MSQGFDSSKPAFLDPLVSEPVRISLSALATHHAGATAPTDPQEGWIWMDTSNPTNISLKAFISSTWITILSNIQAGAPSQSTVDKYTHDQTTPATTWTINHGLSTDDVTITIYDATGLWMLPNTVQIVDDNSVTVTFLTSETGKAVITG